MADMTRCCVFGVGDTFALSILPDIEIRVAALFE